MRGLYDWLARAYRALLAPRAYRAPLAPRVYRAPLAPRVYRAPLAPRVYRAPLAPRVYRAPWALASIARRGPLPSHRLFNPAPPVARLMADC